MIPVALTTRRLVLDAPTLADAGLVTEYCRDPLFERFMLTPWPYERHHAEFFLGTVVPKGWERDTEYTWAIRSDGRFLGVIGYRSATRDIGFWLGAPHRGSGYLPEALGAVADWLFAQGLEAITWECVPGNTASARAAAKAGFTFTGEEPSALRSRTGGFEAAWHGELHSADTRAEKPGWPR